MAAYLINHLRHPGVMQAEVLDYLDRVQATLDPFEGRFIVQGGEMDILEGAWAGSAIVLSFPDMTAARAWYRSVAYQEILRLRTDHLVGDVILVDGVGPGHTPSQFAQKLRSAVTSVKANRAMPTKPGASHRGPTPHHYGRHRTQLAARSAQAFDQAVLDVARES
jgi:uncharacterized protein (DUF1330 family)